MAKLYYDKIINKEINMETNEIWCIEDVPSLWKIEVAKLMNSIEEI